MDLFTEIMPKTPRPHQLSTIEALKRSIHSGNKRICIQLPVGAGKTFVAAMIIQGALEKDNRVVFTVPALSLIDQTVEAFEESGITDIGVIQAQHPRTRASAMVQVASVHTLVGRDKPHAQIWIIDEAHVRSKVIQDLMQAQPAAIFIGLTATPWRKGMAEEYSDLVIGAEMRQLIDDGYLSDYQVYAPSVPDLSKVGTRAGEYKTDQLTQEMQKGELVADVVQTWLEKGQNLPTLCFSVDRAHARTLQLRFERAGITCGYVDAYTDVLERKFIQGQFERGVIKVVVNIGTLTTGIDWDVRCIIMARPTKSKMLYVQSLGRGLRTAEGKYHCIILDHAGNTERLGFVDEIHFTRLFSGKKEDEEPVAKIEALPKKCPSCHFMKPPKTPKCPNCGFKVEAPPSMIEEQAGELKLLKGKATMADKQKWYSELLYIQRTRLRAKGWVSHTYRDKFSVWPKGLEDVPKRPSPEVVNFVKAKDIAFRKRIHG